jgi:hypothetical protein
LCHYADGVILLSKLGNMDVPGQVLGACIWAVSDLLRMTHLMPKYQEILIVHVLGKLETGRGLNVHYYP